MKKIVYVFIAVFFFIALTGAVYYHNGLHDRCPFCSTGKTLLKSFPVQSPQPQLFSFIISKSQISQYLHFSVEIQRLIDVRAPPLAW